MWRWWHDLDMDDLFRIVFYAWLGVVWSFFASVASIIWDFDQSWFDHTQMSDFTFLLRVVLLFPIWGSVQAEHALAAIGLDIGSVWILLVALSGALPAALIGLVHVWWLRRSW